MDSTDAARAWLASSAEASRTHGPAALGIHVRFGPDFRSMGQNQRRKLEQDRIVMARVVAWK